MKYINLRFERLKRNWTQKDLGNFVGRSKQTIHDIEIGRQYPAYPVLCKLEDVFNMSHRYLLQTVDEPSEKDALLKE